MILKYIRFRDIFQDAESMTKDQMNTTLYYVATYFPAEDTSPSFVK